MRDFLRELLVHLSTYYVPCSKHSVCVKTQQGREPVDTPRVRSDASLAGGPHLTHAQLRQAKDEGRKWKPEPEEMPLSALTRDRALGDGQGVGGREEGSVSPSPRRAGKAPNAVGAKA